LSDKKTRRGELDKSLMQIPLHTFHYYSFILRIVKAQIRQIQEQN